MGDQNDGINEKDLIELEHHKQLEFCTTRPAYRQGRKLTAVKTYTIVNESKYLLIFGVPKINIRPELKSLCQKYGTVESLTACSEYPTEDFTECFKLKYQSLQSARFAKRMLDAKNFFGGVFHVCYAPEFENVDETRKKLTQRRADVAKRLIINSKGDSEHEQMQFFNSERNLLESSAVNVILDEEVDFKTPYDDPGTLVIDKTTVFKEAKVESKKDYVFKRKRVRCRNLEVQIKKIKDSVISDNFIGPKMESAVICDKEAAAGRIVVCENREKPRIYKINESNNKIIFNINKKTFD